MSSALLIVAGLAGLLLGADLLVRGGAALASHLGVRPGTGADRAVSGGCERGDGGTGAALRSPTAVQEAIDELTAEARERADATAQDGVERARADGLEAEAPPVPPQAPAWAGLLDAAGQLAADVLVCGTRGRGAFARAVLGSTASSLLHHAELPLLVVPEAEGASTGRSSWRTTGPREPTARSRSSPGCCLAAAR